MTYMGKESKKEWIGTSLVVQQLRLALPLQGVWVQSLVGELGSHMQPSVAKKKINKIK